MSDHYGQWQAQGDDIAKPGHRKDWGQDAVPTKDQGREWLQHVSDMCTNSERKRRQRSFRDADRFLSRAPAGGYPSMMKSFYSTNDRYTDLRVDVEIYGRAFRDAEDDDG